MLQENYVAGNKIPSNNSKHEFKNSIIPQNSDVTKIYSGKY